MIDIDKPAMVMASLLLAFIFWVGIDPMPALAGAWGIICVLYLAKIVNDQGVSL